MLVVHDLHTWRKWLEEHFNKREGVALVVRKKGAPVTGVTYEEALDEAICFGWIDGRTNSRDKLSYVVHFYPRKRNSPWSKANTEKVERLISEGRMAPPGLEKVDDAKRDGRWAAAYETGKKWQLPDDLRAALTANPPALPYFEAFPNSIKNNYIYWVERAKRAETRERRIASVVERSKKGLKPEWM